MTFMPIAYQEMWLSIGLISSCRFKNFMQPLQSVLIAGPSLCITSKPPVIMNTSRYPLTWEILTLEMIKGGSEPLSAQIHFTAVTHSWHPGFAWNRCRIVVSIIRYEASTSPIANPLPSMLYMFFGLILFCSITPLKSSNHFINRFTDTSLILAASINFLLALSMCGWCDIKHATQSRPNGS